MGSKKHKSRREEAHHLRMAIGDLARSAAAPGWSELVVRRGQVGPYAETVVTVDGREIAVEGLDEPFQRLRELSYKEFAGTWFTCELAFTPGRRNYTGRVDAKGVPFVDVPARAALAELTMFASDEPPGWLLAALPTAAPIGLQFGHTGHQRWQSMGFAEQPESAPPINGPLSYVPATVMTAKVLDESRERRADVVRLEGEDDEELMVAHFMGQYLVARHGTRGTDGGLRSVTMEGNVLRLELTDVAADALETEAAFEVRLDLPPGEVDELRAALLRVLGPCAQAPELIGF
ncbi:hypothetical protein SAMN05444920_101982 [Nonomuraea solani]|uniref:Uncharacterized protein n=1 Tax=Nonomuraea solani TaxID=1144553 RepID=A0A1H5VTZ1_9ACTN|nr:hypothetical protein [Nonomuraea solani]SEF90603.1 hypothetical protein SAMN05444920_101982 [Nonomuraea solani]